jgi:hypothetical protein
MIGRLNFAGAGEIEKEAGEFSALDRPPVKRP